MLIKGGKPIHRCIIYIFTDFDLNSEDVEFIFVHKQSFLYNILSEYNYRYLYYCIRNFLMTPLGILLVGRSVSRSVGLS